MTAAPDHPGHLRARPGLFGHRGARAAGADREALEEAGGDVRRTDPDHLLVAAHPLAAAGGERRRRRHRVGEGDDRDGHGTEEELGQVGPGHRRDGERREALRQHADGLDTRVLQVEQVDGERGEHAPRPAPPGTFGSSRCSSRMPTRDATPMTAAVGLTSPSATPETKRLRLVDQAVGVDREPEQLGQLADHDGERQAVHVADLGRLGQQVGDEAEVRQPGHGHDQADEQGQHRRQCDGLGRVAARERQGGDGRRDHRPERRVRAEHEDARRPEDRVAEQAEDRGVETGDRRQPGQLGVRHPLRHEQGREHQAGDDVLGQPAALVGAEQAETGDELRHPGRLLRRLGRGGGHAHRQPPLLDLRPRAPLRGARATYPRSSRPGGRNGITLPG